MYLSEFGFRFQPPPQHRQQPTREVNRGAELASRLKRVNKYKQILVGVYVLDPTHPFGEFMPLSMFSFKTVFSLKT